MDPHYHVSERCFANVCGELSSCESGFGAGVFVKNRDTLSVPGLHSQTPVLNTRDALASQGKYDEADRLYLRSIDITERALGPDHPNLATSLNNRGKLLYIQVRRSYQLRWWLAHERTVHTPDCCGKTRCMDPSHDKVLAPRVLGRARSKRRIHS